VRVLVLGGRDRPTDFLRQTLAARFGGEACRAAIPGESEPAGSVAAWRPAAVVYLAASRGRDGGPDLGDADAALSACLAEGVAHLVAVGSTEAIEPSHHHPGRVPEERSTPRRPDLPRRERWLDFEELLGRRLGGSERPGLTLLRAAPVLAPGLATPWCRLFASRRVATLPGRDPTLQLLAPEDLAEAVAAVLDRRARGTFHLVPRGNVPLHRALCLAGARRLPLPAFLQRLLPGLAPRLGDRRSLDHLPYLRHAWTASGEKMRRELGFTPRRSSAEAVVAYRAALAEERAAGSTVPAAAVEAPCGAVAAATPARLQGLAAVSGATAPPPPELDEFGLDPDYVEAYRGTLFRFLHDVYWRVEVRGLEHVPRRGRAVLVGVHRGFMPWDGVMALHQIAGATGRYPRFLIHPSLLKFPFLAPYMTKLGGIPASQENAGWVLEREEMVAIFPDGIRGAFTPYREAYRLGRSFRDDYARVALRHGAPLIPFATVGSAEIFPIVGRIDWGFWKRLSEWPYLPVTLSLPLVPNPSKWHTWYLPPLDVRVRYPPEAADDPEAVTELAAEVRRRIEGALATMLAARRRIFWGSVFGEEGGA
jgi:1-acyl-sn-glycerol-3-phosphate acyltransferase/nucleoside-diphosphate-sugar epimerase